MEGESMKNSSWKQVGSLEEMTVNYVQLRLFPLTPEEILLARVNELEKTLTEKLERQRKCQFGKIGRNDKKIDDVDQRLAWIEKWICENNYQPERTCEVLEMVGQ